MYHHSTSALSHHHLNLAVYVLLPLEFYVDFKPCVLFKFSAIIIVLLRYHAIVWGFRRILLGDLSMQLLMFYLSECSEFCQLIRCQMGVTCLSVNKNVHICFPLMQSQKNISPV